MSETVRHYTTHQAAKMLGVRPHVIRTMVERGVLPSVLRLPRAELGETAANMCQLMEMISPETIFALRDDPAEWQERVDATYRPMTPRKEKQTPVSLRNEAEGRARRAVDDLMEERRLAAELEDIYD